MYKFAVGALALLLVIACNPSSGPQGPAGPAGPAGPQGAQGLTGAAGPKGDKGEVGQQGAQGELGLQGVPGAKGDKGDPGAQGLQGLRGDPGASVTGVTVAPGDATCEFGGTKLTTTTGDVYVCNGAPGAKGDQGDVGPQGIQGIQGVPGEKGEAGAQGIQGNAGPQGDVGPQGPGGRLIYIQDSTTDLAGQPSVPFFTKTVNLTPGESVGEQLVASFPFDITDNTGLVLQFSGDYLTGTCTVGTETTTTHSVLLALYDRTTGTRIGYSGILTCSPATPAGAKCEAGFSFTAAIPKGRLPPGQYEGRMEMGPSCSATGSPSGPGTASWHIGNASMLVWQPVGP